MVDSQLIGILAVFFESLGLLFVDRKSLLFLFLAIIFSIIILFMT